MDGTVSHTHSPHPPKTLCDSPPSPKAAVMTSELGLIWQDLKGLMDEPTLNQEENRQLQAETCQEVLRICQELYLNYLHLLDRLRRRAVFSDQANRSRLGAQMAIDCTSL